MSVTGVVIVLTTLALTRVATSYVSFRFKQMRPVLEGEPIVLVQNGRIIEQNLRRERLTEDDLAEQARRSEIESLDQINWAVLETNGEISFMKTGG